MHIIDAVCYNFRRWCTVNIFYFLRKILLLEKIKCSFSSAARVYSSDQHFPVGVFSSERSRRSSSGRLRSAPSEPRQLFPPLSLQAMPFWLICSGGLSLWCNLEDFEFVPQLEKANSLSVSRNKDCSKSHFLTEFRLYNSPGNDTAENNRFSWTGADVMGWGPKKKDFLEHCTVLSIQSRRLFRLEATINPLSGDTVSLKEASDVYADVLHRFGKKGTVFSLCKWVHAQMFVWQEACCCCWWIEISDKYR